VDLTKLRWRIERDYQDLKQEVGLGHFEGRGWRGFHHHATLCIAAYGFLVSERETIPPSGSRSTRPFKKLAVSNGYRPRGSATATRTSHPELDCDDSLPSPGTSHAVPVALGNRSVFFCDAVSLGACPNSRCSILSESDSSLGYEQVFSPLEYRSDTAAAAECAGLRAERPCLAVYR